MNTGAWVSNPGSDATTKDNRQLSFSSDIFMHLIGKTEFRELDDDTSVQHFFGYTPIIISYTEDINNAGQYRWAGYDQLTGSNSTLIHIGNSDGDKVRYYALYQGI